MLGQLAAAQLDIEAAIAELSRQSASASALSESRNQLANVGALLQQVASADAKTLSALRSSVAATIASCQTTAQQARASGGADAGSPLATAAGDARTAVNEVMRGMKDFDRNLQFANAQDEADYRRREDERRAYIAAEQAKHTPQGDLNASGAAVGQMADAAAHGAAENPEFQRRWDKLTATSEALRAQLIRDGRDVTEFDNHLRDDLRAIMRAKGMPDAKIDALLAAHRDNPLDAAKQFVAEQNGAIGAKDIDSLEQKAVAYKAMAASDAVVESRTPATPIPASAMDAMADLKALGVVAGDHDAGQPPAHGVTATAQGAAHQSAAIRS